MMDEALEIVKSDYLATGQLKDIWSNPVVKTIIGLIPRLSTAVSSGVEQLIERRQKEKLEELFEIVLKDGEITMDDVQDVDCIMEFAKTIDVVNRLIRNDKIVYMANLLKSSIKEKERDVDEFEELLNKLAALSVREIELLYLLYEEEERICSRADNHGKAFDPEKSWKAFIDKAKVKYGLNESEIVSKMLGIMRTGFCMSEWRSYLSARSALVMYTSPEYRRLLEKIQ